MNRPYLVRKTVFRVVRVFRGSKLEDRRPDGYSLLITTFCRVIRLILLAFSKATVTVAPKFVRRLPRRSLGEGGCDVSALFLIRTCHS
ncbi:MAG: hypothetical protein DME32_09775 [Verrucomicrobia bacterium]|nr:MAG: hypothetical protein DME32_09775 [Verrucomicrobiota bacterium]